MVEVRSSLSAMVMMLLVGCATGTPEKTRAHFEECKEQSGYKTAVLTQVNQDGSFLYKGDDAEANNALRTCLSSKGHSMATGPQAKVETDFYDCAKQVGARGASVVVAPDGAWKSSIAGGGEVSIAQSKTLTACMREKGHRVYDGPGPAR